MSKLIWEDISTYSKGTQIEDMVPHTYKAEINGFEIIIHRHIHYDPTSWLLSAHSFGLICYELGKGTNFTFEEAVKIALVKLSKKLAKYMHVYNYIVEQIVKD